MAKSPSERYFSAEEMRLVFLHELAHLRRGDLVFWKGHVGFYAGDGKLLHANAFHMAVAEEPLGEAINRIRASGSEVLEVRRM